MIWMDIIGRYSLGRLISRGAFCDVHMGFEIETGRKVALKISRGESLLREAKCLAKLKHENIIEFIEHIKEGPKEVLVMEYVDGQDLFKVVEKTMGRGLNESLVVNLFIQLCNAVQHCFAMNLAHRDIKLENILISSKGELKLCDFGLAIELEGKKPLIDDYCGTCGYAAPEILLCKPYDPRMSDAWSVGVVLYVMATGFQPFEVEDEGICVSIDDHERAVKIRTLECVYQDPPSTISEPIRSAIKQLLCPLESRKSIEEVIKNFTSNK